MWYIYFSIGFFWVGWNWRHIFRFAPTTPIALLLNLVAWPLCAGVVAYSKYENWKHQKGHHD